MVPLLIMMYVPGKTASVVTTCILIFAFALGLAVWSSAVRAIELSEYPIVHMSGLSFGRFEPKDIVTATAAYTVVLVVFIGTSITSSST